MRRFNRKGYAQVKAHWMKTLQDEIDRLGGHPGQIDWDTAQYLFDQGERAEDAARKMVPAK